MTPANAYPVQYAAFDDCGREIWEERSVDNWAGVECPEEAFQAEVKINSREEVRVDGLKAREGVRSGGAAEQCIRCPGTK